MCCSHCIKRKLAQRRKAAKLQNRFGGTAYTSHQQDIAVRMLRKASTLDPAACMEHILQQVHTQATALDTVQASSPYPNEYVDNMIYSRMAPAAAALATVLIRLLPVNTMAQK
jgi:ABC-type transport system involved in cytochrome bd biosynthesis fused ATPase/permease subunit